MMQQWPKRKWLDKEVTDEINRVLSYYQDHELDLPGQSYFENRYCKAFSDYLGGGYSDAVNSGSTAAFIALSAIGANPNDHIICSPVTDFGTVSAIALKSCIMSLPDSMVKSFNTSLEHIKNVFHSEVKGVLLTHSSGEPIQDIAEIADFCQQKNLWLIEDCSQAHGASVSGKKVGTFGDISFFSTMHSKNHSTGSNGGILFTKNEILFHKIRSFSDRGKGFHLENYDPKKSKYILFPSLNFGSDEISCAIGFITLQRLDSLIEKRQQFINYLEGYLSKSKLFSICFNSTDSSCYFLPIMINAKCSIDIVAIKDKLIESGLPINPRYEYLVSEWDWSQSFVNKSATINTNVVNFRNHSFNLLFNERFNESHAKEIFSILNTIEQNYG